MAVPHSRKCSVLLAEYDAAIGALRDLFAKLEAMNGCNVYDIHDSDTAWPEFNVASAILSADPS